MDNKGLSSTFENYIDPLPDWQKEICSRARRLILSADPEIKETVKRRVQPYFVCNGNVAALLAAKDHINVFIYDPIAPDPENIINQGHNNATARSIQIFQNDTLNEKAFVKLIQSVAANNKAGGWRKIQSD
jgi:hypothetical protein